jgi:hypothetical protein
LGVDDALNYKDSDFKEKFKASTKVIAIHPFFG